MSYAKIIQGLSGSYANAFLSETLQVGEDVVAELQTAMEKHGVDMRVAALVSSSFLISSIMYGSVLIHTALSL